MISVDKINLTKQGAVDDRLWQLVCADTHSTISLNSFPGLAKISQEFVTLSEDGNDTRMVRVYTDEEEHFLDLKFTPSRVIYVKNKNERGHLEKEEDSNWFSKVLGRPVLLLRGDPNVNLPCIPCYPIKT